MRCIMTDKKEVQQSVYALTKRYSRYEVSNAMRDIMSLNRARQQLEDIKDFIVHLEECKIDIPPFVRQRQRSIERKFHALECELEQ